jgi:hypothetical protein
MLGLKSFRSAAVTLAGIELAHRIRKKQHLLPIDRDGRCWRYCYRYGGKRRTLSLGIYPEVPVDRARSRHLAARQLLAAGVDPSLKREELRGTFRLKRW